MEMLVQLHELGYQRLRLSAGASPAGMHWRYCVAPVEQFETNGYMLQPDHLLAGPPAGRRQGARLHTLRPLRAAAGGRLRPGALLGTALRSSALLLAGYLLGARWELVLDVVDRFELVLWAVVFALLAAWVVWRLRARARHRAS